MCPVACSLFGIIAQIGEVVKSVNNLFSFTLYYFNRVIIIPANVASKVATATRIITKEPLNKSTI